MYPINLDEKNINNEILATKYLQTKSNNVYKKCLWSIGIYSSYTSLVQHLKINNVINYINRLTKKNHMIISIESEKALGKVQHPFIIFKKSLAI